MHFTSTLRRGAWTLGLLAAAVTAQAQTTVPYTFAAGSPAKAGEVNANFQALASAINGLSARLDKVEGKTPLTVADVAGTYRFQSLQTELANGGGQVVSVYTFDGTMTLNADGSASFTTTDTGAKAVVSGGSGNTPLNVARSILSHNNPTGSASWTLSGNVLHIGSGSPFYLIDGGRLAIQTSTNTADATSKVILIVRTN